MAQVITLAQLGEHNTREDLWMAVHGKVYNLTTFAEDHPGGIDVLKECAGTDATDSYDYVGHTAGATKTMQQYLVGSLEGAKQVAESAPVASPSPAAHPGASAAKSGGPFKSAVPLLSAATGFGLLIPLRSIARKRDEPGFISELWSRIGNRGFGDPTTNVLFYILIAVILAVGAGFSYLYSEFDRTLHEKEVFSYPSVIPRKSRK
ncbi:cytochrome b5-like heme/steroid binding domain-containing protein [Durotheca rogersii]|uniref:cytochrome b5-like heme/steroid binding domain-containing protein n=1 Tax=Durotheca rogersii TaxID=419775 RepID=UPI00221E9AF9|nr:cytochrome b5-like heme/steroid binding domain-containing protein [Durotheca rogersii]KAI5867881.1 cytochrome b5-like heme/steroid binding domain-containing protein [Durotheca rogersii]